MQREFISLFLKKKKKNQGFRFSPTLFFFGFQKKIKIGLFNVIIFPVKKIFKFSSMRKLLKVIWI